MSNYASISLMAWEAIEEDNPRELDLLLEELSPEELHHLMGKAEQLRDQVRQRWLAATTTEKGRKRG